MRIRTFVLAGAAAAALAYLFEPTGGRARRERLRASLGSLARLRGRTIDRSVPLPGNLAPRPARREPPPSATSSIPIPPAIPTAPPATTRASTEATPDVPPREVAAERPRGQIRHGGEDDEDIVDRVTSTLRERPDLRAEDLVIDVVNGIAYLSGDLHDPHTFGEIVDVTGNVPGVRRVQSLLHLPDSETISRTVSAHRVGEDTDRQR